MTTTRTTFADPTVPDTPIVVRDVDRRVTTCPDCGASVGPIATTGIACPYRRRP